MADEDALIDGALERRWQTLRARIEAEAEALRRQGSIAAKLTNGRRVWVLRFHSTEASCRRYRSIYLGGDDQPELLHRARELLACLRAEGNRAREVAAYARLARDALGAARDLIRAGRKGRGGRRAG